MGRNMETGETNLNKRRKSDVYGDNLPDPFFDNYAQEEETACDILRLLDNTDTPLVTMTFGKVFLRKIIRSHVLYIKEIEKAL